MFAVFGAIFLYVLVVVAFVSYCIASLFIKKMSCTIRALTTLIPAIVLYFEYGITPVLVAVAVNIIGLGISYYKNQNVDAKQ